MDQKAYFGLGAGIVCLAISGWFATSRDAPAKADNAPPRIIPVTAGLAVSRDIPHYVRGIGTVQAYNMVTVKSRVDGHIVQVSFVEGQEIKAGAQLFQIDPRPYQAALAQTEGARDRDQAQLQAALLDLDRFAKLLGKGVQSRQSYEHQKASVEQLQGAIKSDEAQIENAKLNLAYADIRSPISGRTGARLVDQGNFIQASQDTALATITQVKPIFVSFTIPQNWLDAIRRDQEASSLAVRAYASDDRQLLSEGKLSLIDNQIDTTTGTVRLKAVFENADERLWPGEFVSARVVLKIRRNVVTVPAETVMQGPNGSYVYVINPDDKVERKPVQLAGIQDGLAMVEKGLEAGQRVVVEGQYRLTNGLKVRIDQPPSAPPS